MTYMGKTKRQSGKNTGKKMAKSPLWRNREVEIKEWSELKLGQKIFVVAIVIVGILILIHSFIHPIPGNSIAFH